MSLRGRMDSWVWKRSGGGSQATKAKAKATETRGAQQPKLMHREEVNSMHVGRQASRQVGK